MPTRVACQETARGEQQIYKTAQLGAENGNRRKGYGMKLSRYEQEIVINFNADEKEATVYTANPAWVRKMDKLCNEFPEIIRLKSWTEISKTYVLPKNLVKIGKPRTLSEAQLRHLRELQNKA